LSVKEHDEGINLSNDGTNTQLEIGEFNNNNSTTAKHLFLFLNYGAVFRQRWPAEMPLTGVGGIRN